MFSSLFSGQDKDDVKQLGRIPKKSSSRDTAHETGIVQECGNSKIRKKTCLSKEKENLNEKSNDRVKSGKKHDSDFPAEKAQHKKQSFSMTGDGIHWNKDTKEDAVSGRGENMDLIEKMGSGYDVKALVKRTLADGRCSDKSPAISDKLFSSPTASQDGCGIPGLGDYSDFKDKIESQNNQEDAEVGNRKVCKTVNNLQVTLLCNKYSLRGLPGTDIHGSVLFALFG